MQRLCLIDEKNELLSLIDEMQMGLYQFDLKGLSMFSNTIFQSRLGYMEEEIDFKTYLSYLVKRTVKFSIGQVKANTPFSIKRLTCISKRWISHSL